MLLIGTHGLRTWVDAAVGGEESVGVYSIKDIDLAQLIGMMARARGRTEHLQITTYGARGHVVADLAAELGARVGRVTLRAPRPPDGGCPPAWTYEPGRTHLKSVQFDDTLLVVPTINLHRYGAHSVETIWAGHPSRVEIRRDTTLARELQAQPERARVATFGVHPRQVGECQPLDVLLYHRWASMQRGEGPAKHFVGWPEGCGRRECAVHAKWAVWPGGRAWLTSANLQRNLRAESYIELEAGSEGARLIAAVHERMVELLPITAADIRTMLDAVRHDFGLGASSAAGAADDDAGEPIDHQGHVAVETPTPRGSALPPMTREALLARAWEAAFVPLPRGAAAAVKAMEFLARQPELAPAEGEASDDHSARVRALLERARKERLRADADQERG